MIDNQSLLNVVKECVGDCQPIGTPFVDAKHMHNLRVLIDVTNWCMKTLSDCANNTEKEWSCRQSALTAQKPLNEYRQFFTFTPTHFNEEDLFIKLGNAYMADWEMHNAVTKALKDQGINVEGAQSTLLRCVRTILEQYNPWCVTALEELANDGETEICECIGKEDESIVCHTVEELANVIFNGLTNKRMNNGNKN